MFYCLTTHCKNTSWFGGWGGGRRICLEANNLHLNKFQYYINIFLMRMSLYDIFLSLWTTDIYECLWDVPIVLRHTSMCFSLLALGGWTVANSRWGASDMSKCEDIKSREAECTQTLFPGRMLRAERLPCQSRLCQVRMSSWSSNYSFFPSVSKMFCHQTLKC